MGMEDSYIFGKRLINFPVPLMICNTGYTIVAPLVLTAQAEVWLGS